MNDRETSEFKIRLDGENPDTGLQQEVEDSRISKLNQKVTLISILLPCLIIAIVLFLYLDAKKEVTATFHTGSQEIQSLSQKIESRFSEVIMQNEKREDEFKQKIGALEKALADLTKKVNENSKTVKNLDESKASKTSVSSSMTKLNSSLDSLNSDLETLSNEIKVLGKNLTGELDSLKVNLNSQNKKIEILQVNLSNLASSAISRKDLQRMLSDQKKIIQQEMEDKFDSIQLRINTLEGVKPSVQLPPQRNKNETDSLRPTNVPESKPIQTGEPLKKSELPQSGTIIEQDIQ